MKYKTGFYIKGDYSQLMFSLKMIFFSLDSFQKSVNIFLLIENNQ